MGGMPGMGLGGMGAMGGMGGMGGMGRMASPYSNNYNNFWGGSSQGGRGQALGALPNPAIVGASATVYSAHVSGISKNNLMGRGVALCRSVAGGRCQGFIPYCCTIGRDSLGAMELFVRDNDDG